MRPVSKPPLPKIYKEASALEQLSSFKGEEPLPKYALIDTIKELVEIWVESKCNPRTNKGDINFNKAEDKAIYRGYLKKLNEGYSWGSARRDLIEAIGAYCSYCDSPISSHLHIEHRLPKSLFPEFAFNYANFLLACPTCNSAKGNSPNQATILDRPTSTTSAKVYIENIFAPNYLWADFPWQNLNLVNPGIFPFACELYWITHYRNKLVPKQPIPESERGWLLTQFQAGLLGNDAGLYYAQRPGDRTKNYFSIMIVPVEAAGKLQWQAAGRIIALASLNKIQPSDKKGKSVDKRLETRTRAYFTAHIVKALLRDAAIMDPLGTTLLPAVIEQAKQIIRATGQWLIWLTVLGNDSYRYPYKNNDHITAQVLVRGCMEGTSEFDWMI